MADRAVIYGYYLDEIRRISPETPVTLCSERRVVWEAVADKLRVTPETLYCCCGGLSVPGRTGSAKRVG